MNSNISILILTCHRRTARRYSGYWLFIRKCQCKSNESRRVTLPYTPAVIDNNEQLIKNHVSDLTISTTTVKKLSGGNNDDTMPDKSPTSRLFSNIDRTELPDISPGPPYSIRSKTNDTFISKTTERDGTMVEHPTHHTESHFSEIGVEDGSYARDYDRRLSQTENDEPQLNNDDSYLAPANIVAHDKHPSLSQSQRLNRLANASLDYAGKLLREQLGIRPDGTLFDDALKETSQIPATISELEITADLRQSTDPLMHKRISGSRNKKSGKSAPNIIPSQSDDKFMNNWLGAIEADKKHRKKVTFDRNVNTLAADLVIIGRRATDSITGMHSERKNISNVLADSDMEEKKQFDIKQIDSKLGHIKNRSQTEKMDFKVGQFRSSISERLENTDLRRFQNFGGVKSKRRLRRMVRRRREFQMSSGTSLYAPSDFLKAITIEDLAENVSIVDVEQLAMDDALRHTMIPAMHWNAQKEFHFRIVSEDLRNTIHETFTPRTPRNIGYSRKLTFDEKNLYGDEPPYLLPSTGKIAITITNLITLPVNREVRHRWAQTMDKSIKAIGSDGMLVLGSIVRSKSEIIGDEKEFGCNSNSLHAALLDAIPPPDRRNLTVTIMPDFSCSVVENGIHQRADTARLNFSLKPVHKLKILM